VDASDVYRGTEGEPLPAEPEPRRVEAEPERGGLDGFFKLTERGTTVATELRAGLTTFMVMAYIIFVNANVLGDPNGAGLNPVAVAAATALVAGVLTIAMGLIANYPFALAAGLGINAIVSYTLAAGLGLGAAGAMGIIVLEGLAVSVLVVVGFREAVMTAIPLSLKRAIGVGIGLFILFIGFVNGGLIATPLGGVPLVGFVFPTSLGALVTVLGLLITIALFVLQIRGALILSIIVTTIIALLLGVAKIPADLFNSAYSFETLGQFDLGKSFADLGIFVAILTIFSIMLIDFFDTMGTVTGVAEQAGLTTPDGQVPGVGRVLLVDSIGAAVGGMAGISSNTTYIESAAGVAEGGRTGLTAVVVGVLFLAAILLSPLAGIVPAQATAPVLILVGFLMFTLIRDINIADVDDGIPALLTMILMTLTYDISIGIGAGFISWTFIRVIRGRMGEIHPLMWVVTIAFAIFFAKDYIQPLLPK
jgi:AGZA family xanthine/uracil permease-like MFS transporter